MAASHYEILGVHDDAPPDDVRRAYHDLARQLHPDRWRDAPLEEREGADHRMREINEAWRVLGNPGRRLAYDAGRRRTGRPASATSGSGAGSFVGVPFPSGDLFVDEPPPDPVARLFRALPWALMVLALGGIFVFTAYATGDADDVRSCVQRDGSTAVSVPCDASGARVVELRVTDVGQCPDGTEPFQPAVGNQALCLAT